MTGVKAERNGANGVQVVGPSTDRAITGITTTGNHSYGIVAAAQNKPRCATSTRPATARGGLRINRCTDCVIRDITTQDQPIGLFMHVNTTNATLENMRDRRAARRRGGEDHQGRSRWPTRRSTAPGSPGSRSAATTSRSKASAVNDARTGVRIERGAGNIVGTGLKLTGGQDGLVTTAGTKGVVVTDLTPTGSRTTPSATSPPACRSIGGHINGGLTGIDAYAATTISGTAMSLSNEGIRARTTEQVTMDNVAVDAVTVGMNVAEGSPVVLTNSRVHAFEAVRGVLSPRARATT